MTEKTENKRPKYTIVATERQYVPKNDASLKALVSDWFTCLNTGTINFFASKQMANRSRHYELRDGTSKETLKKAGIDGTLILDGASPEITARFLSAPHIVMQHCAGNPDANTQLHGDVVLSVFRHQDIRNPLLTKLLTGLGLHIGSLNTETSNFELDFVREPTIEKIDPPLQTITSQKLYDTILEIAGKPNSLLQELSDPRYKTRLWGILYLLLKTKLVTGHYEDDYIWNPETNRAEAQVSDRFKPEYLTDESPYGNKLAEFKLGRLDALDLEPGELLELFKAEQKILEGESVNWDNLINSNKNDVQKFIDTYPYYRLALNFQLHPYQYALMQPNDEPAVLNFSIFTDRLSQAVASYGAHKRGFMKVPQTATSLFDIVGVKNYDLTDGQNRVDISISRSSGFCQLHQKPKHQ